MRRGLGIERTLEAVRNDEEMEVGRELSKGRRRPERKKTRVPIAAMLQPHVFQYFFNFSHG